MLNSTALCSSTPIDARDQEGQQCSLIHELCMLLDSIYLRAAGCEGKLWDGNVFFGILISKKNI